LTTELLYDTVPLAHSGRDEAGALRRRLSPFLKEDGRRCEADLGANYTEILPVCWRARWERKIRSLDQPAQKIPRLTDYSDSPRLDEAMCVRAIARKAADCQ
jgi:hypothetical protein